MVWPAVRARLPVVQTFTFSSHGMPLLQPKQASKINNNRLLFIIILLFFIYDVVEVIMVYFNSSHYYIMVNHNMHCPTMVFPCLSSFFFLWIPVFLLLLFCIYGGEAVHGPRLRITVLHRLNAFPKHFDRGKSSKAGCSVIVVSSCWDG